MNAKIRKLKRQLKTIELAEQRLKALKVHEEECYDQLAILESSIKQKLKTVERFSTLTIFHLYRRIIGDADVQMEIAKQHYLELCIEYNDLLLSVEGIAFEKEILQEKIKDASRLKKSIRTLVMDEDAESPSAKKWKAVTKEILTKLHLEAELEEAIEHGVLVNKKLNKAIRVLKKYATQQVDKKKRRKVLELPVQVIQLYQRHIVSVKHTLVQYELEINDVYQIILENKNYKNQVLSNFMRTYRKKLARDIDTRKGLGESYEFLVSFKEAVMSLTRALRSDRRSLIKQIAVLEQQEDELLSS